jgi:hypothetical protein
VQGVASVCLYYGFARILVATREIQVKSLSRSRGKEITIIEPDLEGHRADQLAAIRSLVSDHGIHADHKTKLWPHIFTRNPLLFPSIDGSFLAFLVVAPIRALLLRRTVAIWHRPKTSTHGRGLKRYAKYYGAKVIKSVPLVALISVQKPELQPEISTLVTDWIYQIANWYQPSGVLERPDESRAFAELIRQHANARPIIIYLGEISAEKGFEFFTDLLLEDKCAEFAFVAAGKVKQRNADAVRRFIDGRGLLVNRYLSDSEFLAGINVAHWVWNCYRSDNDQNSGIFGFAYLAGARVIVRGDSYVARVALDLQFPTVQVRYGDVKRALEKIRASRTLMIEKPKPEMISIMKERTRERLLYYLGCLTARTVADSGRVN